MRRSTWSIVGLIGMVVIGVYLLTTFVAYPMTKIGWNDALAVVAFVVFGVMAGHRDEREE